MWLINSSLLEYQNVGRAVRVSQLPAAAVLSGGVGRGSSVTALVMVLSELWSRLTAVWGEGLFSKGAGTAPTEQ